MEEINKKLDTIIKLLERLDKPAISQHGSAFAHGAVVQQPRTYQCPFCHEIVTVGANHICSGTTLAGGTHKS